VGESICVTHDTAQMVTTNRKSSTEYLIALSSTWCLKLPPDSMLESWYVAGNVNVIAFESSALFASLIQQVVSQQHCSSSFQACFMQNWCVSYLFLF
jgi:hypothetical protein